MPSDRLPPSTLYQPLGVIVVASPPSTANTVDYVLDSLTVTDANGNKVTVTNNSFTMPSSNVTITATFKEPRSFQIRVRV